VPSHLRDAHYPGAKRIGHGDGYVYPHDVPEGIVAQRYAPDVIDGRTYYEPSGHGMEGRFSERARLIRQILHADHDGHPERGSHSELGSHSERGSDSGRDSDSGRGRAQPGDGGKGDEGKAE
jgi:hypothetical protein